MLALDHLTATLLEITVVFALSVAVGWSFLRLRMPPLVGYLCAGAVVGPQALGLVHESGLVEHLAEVGVIVLLFSVGLELSFRDLRRMSRQVSRYGATQVVGTVVLGAGVAMALGSAPGPAVFGGCLLALSSTATISRLLVERGDLGTPPGQATLSTCIAQDLAVVPMVLALPLMAGIGSPAAALGRVGISLAAFGALATVSWFAVPRLLDMVARTRSRELYLLSLLTSCLAVSVVTALLGMSFALGAFLVGAVVGSSLHHHQASSEIEPLRDALASLFFFSIGMLFDPGVLLDAPEVVLAVLLAVVGGKAVIAYVAVRLWGGAPWVALRSALMLAQVGEFSFVLARIGREVSPDLLPPTVERAFLVVAVISIAATPALFGLGRRLVRRLPAEGPRVAARELANHVVVVGYGPVGQHLVSALRALELPYRAVELNPDTVRRARADGVDMVQGDATRPIVLRALRVYAARMLVVATNAPSAVPKVVRAARDQNPGLHVLVRANYLGDVPMLQRLGVDDIVPQELETSVELLSRCLRHLLVAEDDILRELTRIRRNAPGGVPDWQPADQQSGAHLPGAQLPVPVPGLRAAAFRVEPGSAVAGRLLGECGLRRDTGVSVVALSREDRSELAIGPETTLAVGDVVVCIGGADGLGRAAAAFRGPLGH